MDIMTGGKLSSIWLANMKLIYWSVRSSGRRGGDEIKRVDGVIVILARCDFHFIREYENLVKDPSKDISIPYIIYKKCYNYRRRYPSSRL